MENDHIYKVGERAWDGMKLMIVAHPDDESLFAGGSLLDGGWFVVCVTNGDNKIRREEFEAVMSVTRSEFLMLDYPDRFHRRLNEARLENDLRRIILTRAWDIIVSHSANGEYGHLHHKQIHNVVKRIAGSFWSFSFDGEPLTDVVWKKKLDLIELYRSQKEVCDRFVCGDLAIRNEGLTLVPA